MPRILLASIASLLLHSAAIAQPPSTVDALWNSLIRRIYDVDLPVSLAEVTLDRKADASDRDYACGKAAEAERLLGVFQEALSTARNAGAPQGEGKNARNFFEREDRTVFYRERIADIRKQAACQTGLS